MPIRYNPINLLYACIKIAILITYVVTQTKQRSFNLKYKIQARAHDAHIDPIDAPRNNNSLNGIRVNGYIGYNMTAI